MFLFYSHSSPPHKSFFSNILISNCLSFNDLKPLKNLYWVRKKFTWNHNIMQRPHFSWCPRWVDHGNNMSHVIKMQTQRKTQNWGCIHIISSPPPTSSSSSLLLLLYLFFFCRLSSMGHRSSSNSCQAYLIQFLPPPPCLLRIIHLYLKLPIQEIFRVLRCYVVSWYPDSLW